MSNPNYERFDEEDDDTQGKSSKMRDRAARGLRNLTGAYKTKESRKTYINWCYFVVAAVYLVAIIVTWAIGAKKWEEQKPLYQMHFVMDGSNTTADTLDSMLVVGIVPVAVFTLYAIAIMVSAVNGGGPADDDTDVSIKMTFDPAKMEDPTVPYSGALDLWLVFAQLTVLPLLSVTLFYQFGIQTRFAAFGVAMAVSTWIFVSIPPMILLDVLHVMISKQMVGKNPESAIEKQRMFQSLFKPLTEPAKAILVIMCVIGPAFGASYVFSMFSLAYINSGQWMERDRLNTSNFYLGTTAMWAMFLTYFIADILCVTIGVLIPLGGYLNGSEKNVPIGEDWQKPLSYYAVIVRHGMLAILTLILCSYMSAAITNEKYTSATLAPTPFMGL